MGEDRVLLPWTQLLQSAAFSLQQRRRPGRRCHEERCLRVVVVFYLTKYLSIEVGHVIGSFRLLTDKFQVREDTYESLQPN